MVFVFTISKKIKTILAFILKIKASHIRTYDKYGVEIKPNKIENSTLTLDQLAELIGKDTKQPIPKSLGIDQDTLKNLHPSKNGMLIFWISQDQIKNMGLKDGEDIVASTQGNSIFLSKLVRADSGDFAGMENENLLNQIKSKTDKYKDDEKANSSDGEWD